jgi:hypothetical protein
MSTSGRQCHHGITRPTARRMAVALWLLEYVIFCARLNAGDLAREAVAQMLRHRENGYTR